MIENIIGYILGVCVGCILYKKIERINIDINKLNELNDSIKAKVETSLLPSSTGGRHGA